MKLTVHVVTHATFYGLDVDPPADVVAKGEEAITEWANKNIWTIDAAPVEHSSTSTIIKVESVTIEG